MLRLRRFLPVLGCVLAAIAFVANGPKKGPSSRDGKTCGTVVIPPGIGLGAPPASVDSLNPLLSGSLYDGEASGLLYRNLLWVNRAHRITWSRSIAKSIRVSSDDTVFTVTMRPWRWSDGVPVTARDVNFTYQLIKRMGPVYLNYDSGGIPNLVKSFTELGAEKFRIITTRPVNPEWFELTGLAQLVPYPEHAWRKYTIDEMFRRQTDPNFFKVVDGPYEIERFRIGRYITFVPNPTYAGRRSTIGRLVLLFLHSSEGEVEALKAGTIDMSNLPFSLWPLRDELAGIRVVRLMPNFGFDFIQLNFRKPSVWFFRSLRVRQAIADAINQRAIIRLLYHGYARVQHGPVSVEPPIFLSPTAMAGHYPVHYDPAKARQLLDGAGWKPGKDGIRVRDGRRLSFTYLQSSGAVTSTLESEMIQQNLRAVGIEMRIRQLTFNELVALSERPMSWDAIGFGWSLGNYPDDGPQFHTGAAYNQAGYSNTEMDALLDAVTAESGMRALYAYQDFAALQQPEIFLPQPGAVVLVREPLRGIRKAFPPSGTWAPQYLQWNTGPCRRSSWVEAGAR